MRKIARKAVWLSSQVGGKERVPIVRKVSYLKEKLPLRDVGPTPSSSFSSDILCPQRAAFTFVIFQFSLLPSCSFISSLFPVPVSSTPASLLHAFPPPPFTKVEWCCSWAQEELLHWVPDTVRASFWLWPHSPLDRGGTSQSCLVVIHAWEFDGQSAAWAEI